MIIKQYHQPVLVKEVIAGFKVEAEGRYIDATVGGGGHTEEILKKGGKVLGIDRDREAIDYVSKKFNRWIEQGNLKLENTNFSHLGEAAVKNGWKKADGVLFDLGMSSHQINTTSRGFSFQSNGPLDMRMDSELAVKASDLVNALSEKELGNLFMGIGGEKKARLISRAIVKARKIKRIETTRDLVEVIEGVVKRDGHLHPATKIFMALRMAVNNELDSLEEALPQAVDLLAGGGRLAVISFHDGEDQIVKNFIKGNEFLKVINKKPLMAGQIEIISNPRARSAKLRLAERI